MLVASTNHRRARRRPAGGRVEQFGAVVHAVHVSLVGATGHQHRSVAQQYRIVLVPPHAHVAHATKAASGQIVHFDRCVQHHRGAPSAVSADDQYAPVCEPKGCVTFPRDRHRPGRRESSGRGVVHFRACEERPPVSHTTGEQHLSICHRHRDVPRAWHRHRACRHEPVGSRVEDLCGCDHARAVPEAARDQHPSVRQRRRGVTVPQRDHARNPHEASRPGIVYLRPTRVVACHREAARHQHASVEQRGGRMRRTRSAHRVGRPDDPRRHVRSRRNACSRRRLADARRRQQERTQGTDHCRCEHASLGMLVLGRRKELRDSTAARTPDRSRSSPMNRILTSVLLVYAGISRKRAFLHIRRTSAALTSSSPARRAHSRGTRPRSRRR